MPKTPPRFLAFAFVLAAACHQGRPNLAALPACKTETVAANNADGGNRLAVNPAETFDSAWTIIERSHWDPAYNGVNWNAVRDSLRPKAARAQTNGELRGVLNTMIGTLNQSHFAILPGEVVESREKSAEAADRSGVIGVVESRETSAEATDHSGVIGATVREVQSALLITAVRTNSGAARSGLRPGYVIESVDGCAVAPRLAQIPTGLEARHAKLEAWRIGTMMLNGPVGSTVQVSARDEHGNIRNFAVTREDPPGELVKFGNLPPLPANLEFSRKSIGSKTVGVISFNIWMPVLAHAFTVAMDSLRNADAIVIDVRGNFGGIGIMSATFAGHFTDSALTLGTMLMRGNQVKYVINPQRVNSSNQRVEPFSGPLAVVMDELSISTTEIFAAGLQSIGRARLFGVQTAGEALPSVVERLPNGDLLHHAIANYVLPNGKPVEGSGAIPDVVAPVTRAALLKGGDPALDLALAWAASAAKPKRNLAPSVPQPD